MVKPLKASDREKLKNKERIKSHYFWTINSKTKLGTNDNGIIFSKSQGGKVSTLKILIPLFLKK